MLGMHLDRLVTAAAANEFVPLYMPAQPGRRARAAHLWVTAQDRERYLDATSDTVAEPEPGTVDDNDPAEPGRLPLSRQCVYQERTEEKERRGRLPRDTKALMPAGITLHDPATLAAPRADTEKPVPAEAPPPPPPTAPPANAPRRDRRATAVSLGCAPGHVGPCAACRQLTHRYGVGGNPLCGPCRDRRREHRRT
ncbi:hypothetical protein ACWCXX_37665 [Streptomyces sp. NPDC001732]